MVGPGCKPLKQGGREDEEERATAERRARWPFWPGAKYEMEWPDPGLPILEALSGRKAEPELPGVDVARALPEGQIPATADQAEPEELLADFRPDPELAMFDFGERDGA